jgi:rSAM/selenodomain-associated transferase 1
MLPLIIVFAKAPQPGLVKTRLIPALGARGAASLARQMLQHTLAQAMAAELGGVELCMSPSPGDAAWQTLVLPEGLQFSSQGDGDLGARMARAAQRALERHPSVLLIGSDCPALDAPRLRRAAQALARHGATLHPAADGGYALLGLSRFDGSLFEAIAWSTPGVAATTRARFARLGWPLHEGETLSDIDLPDDLPQLPPHLAPIREERLPCAAP